MTTFAYLRGSTDRQDIANQRHGLLDCANAHGLSPLRFVEDTTSGRVAWRERAIGQVLSAMATPGDVVLVAEISRMARSTLQVLEMLALGMERQLHLHIAKQQMILDSSLNSRITAAVLGLAAEIERELIAARTREALAKRRAEGKPLGRPRGAKSARLKLDTHADEIRRYVGKGLSTRSMAKLVGCAESTLYDWLARRRVSPHVPVIEMRSEPVPKPSLPAEALTVATSPVTTVLIGPMWGCKPAARSTSLTAWIAGDRCACRKG